MGGSKRTDEDRSVRVTESAPVVPGVIQDFVDGYLVPVDPMDDLHCESCQ
jgi:hypothetical protein